MKARSPGLLLLSLGVWLSACAEPAVRDVEAGLVILPLPSAPADGPKAVASGSAVVAPSVVTAPHLDELKKQELLRALEEAQTDVMIQKAPRPRGSAPACAASDPLCD